MHQIQLALELYKSNTGVYPPLVLAGSPPAYRENSCYSGGSGDQGVPGGGWTNTLNVLVSTNLISSLPNDPINTGIKNGVRKNLLNICIIIYHN